MNASRPARARGTLRLVAAAALAFAGALSFPACSEDEPQQQGESALFAPLPCDVETIFANHCRDCHGERPQFGAPMPLVGHDDLHAPGKSDAGKKVFELVGARIHSATRPMPPGKPLDSASLAVLDAWVAAGAPKGQDASCRSDGGTSAKVGPDALPCTVTQSFRAHNEKRPDDATPYALAKDAGNLEMCFTFAVPWSAATKMTAFAPIIDDARALHHWILFATATPQPDGDVRPCSGSMPADARFLAGWAPGAQNVVLPNDVGLELPPPGGSLILQVHYWNAAGLSDVRDRSGIALCTTETPRAHTASWSTLGTLNINIPPRSTNHTTRGTCTPATTEPIHLLAAAPHMHRYGRSIETRILRGGDPARAESLVRVDPWDFEAQRGHPVDVVVQPGDVLETVCRYDNPTATAVTFGERTEDEMCFDFVMAYPAGALATERGRERRLCIDPAR